MLSKAQYFFTGGLLAAHHTEIITAIAALLVGKIAPRMRASYVRRGIVVVLTMSGLALLEKAGWVRLGRGDDYSHPKTIVLIGCVMLSLAPVVSTLVRRSRGRSVFARRTNGPLEKTHVLTL